MIPSLVTNAWGRLQSRLALERESDTPSRAFITSANVGLGLLAIVVLSDPVLAQSTGASLCETALAETVMNIFTVIQFGGPLIGGVVALGATVGLSVVRRSDHKREIKELRNQGIVWGVVVAPLGTVIIQFILNSIVAGGASCTF
ncbi:hypothetical protein [Salinigranum halophilum]|uniref:hypothetical protein n=2 Tax=Salinigranum halophilum TaxID=2565931 RepID=UPI0010A7A3BB|nr:hypothetical protein [Salinigranum halophilum]